MHSRIHRRKSLGVIIRNRIIRYRRARIVERQLLASFLKRERPTHISHAILDPPPSPSPSSVSCSFTYRVFPDTPESSPFLEPSYSPVPSEELAEFRERSPSLNLSPVPFIYREEFRDRTVSPALSTSTTLYRDRSPSPSFSSSSIEILEEFFSRSPSPNIEIIYGCITL